MKVSIIIPIYNVEKYIERCLRSVFAQSYQNLECILVNDSTPDKSFLIAKELIDDYRGCIEFHLIEHEKNSGLSAARNSGIRKSTGDYLFFLDSDDELPNDAISNLVETAVKNKNPWIVMGTTRRLKTDNTTEDQCSLQKKSFYTNDEVFKGYLKGEWYIIACNKLIRKDIFFEHGTFFKEGITHEDVLWSFEVSTYIENLIICSNITYLYYLVDTNSISRSQLSSKRVLDSLTILETKSEYIGRTVDNVLLAKHIKENTISLVYATVRNGFSLKDIKGYIHRAEKLLSDPIIQKTKCTIPTYRIAVYKFLKYICL